MIRRITPHPAASTADDSASPPQFKPKPLPRPQPLKRLPSDRIRFKSQLDIIRAYGAASQNGSRAVNYREAAKFVSLDPSTVSMLNPFLVENGLAERSGNDLLPSKAVLDFATAHTWSAETAARKLLPVIERSWFGVTLRTKLAFRPMTEEEAVTELGQEIKADPDFRPRLAMLIDYAEAAGLLRREGNQLYLVGAQEEAMSTVASDDAANPATAEASSARDAAPARSTGAVGTGFMSTEGAVQFHVSIRVTMQEMAGWSPDRISAFFAGLAQVLAAKQGAEEIQQ